jgi:hypothetical protein
MKIQASRHFVALWSAASLGTLTLSQWLMFKAGCAGDVKGGASGDPILALEIESQAIFVEFIGLLLTSALVAYLCRSKRGGPGAYGTAFLSLLL